MPYRSFVQWNVVGGVLWGTTFSLLGYLAGRSHRLVEERAGIAGAALVLVGVVAVAVYVLRRRSRAASRSSVRED